MRDLLALRDRLDSLARRARGRVQRAPKTTDGRQERTLRMAQAEHRISTTLALIEGWARTLEHHWDTLDPDTRENGLATIGRRAVDAREEVEELLLHARADMAEVEADYSRVDVSRVLGQMVSAYRGPKGGPEVSFVGQSPLYAWIDLTSLNQICSILIDSAIKCSPPDGEITVCASARDGKLVVEVLDQCVRLFDSEAVLASSGAAGAAGGAGAGPATGSEPVGSALGLHTVQALVRSMAGELTVHRHERGGSAVEVVLPLDRRPKVTLSN